MTTTANKKIEMYARIKKHGEDIKKIFSLPADTDPIKLCKKLYKFEKQAQAIQMLQYNGNYKEAAFREGQLFGRLMVFLLKDPDNKFKIFLNYDPRGYALKIPDDIVKEKNLTIHKDWGEFGILAPDLNES